MEGAPQPPLPENHLPYLQEDLDAMAYEGLMTLYRGWKRLEEKAAAKSKELEDYMDARFVLGPETTE